MKIETCWDVVERLLGEHDDLSSENIARLLCRELKVSVRTGEVLLPMLTAAIAAKRRAKVRSIERQVFSDEGSATSPMVVETAAGLTVDVVALRDLLSEELFSVDGKQVVWGEATIQQHLARAAWLRDQQRALEETVRRHLASVEVIERFGVSCLNEVPVAV